MSRLAWSGRSSNGRTNSRAAQLVALAAFASMCAMAYTSIRATLMTRPPNYGIPVPSKPSGRLPQGAIASESDVCSNIGLDMIHDGGNAADAMIALVFCIGVVAMYHGGIGGGGFMIIRSSNAQYEAVDFRETALAASSENTFVKDPKASVSGGLASGVPGEVQGLQYLHSNYAKLSWEHLIQPSIRLARMGFQVNEDMVYFIKGQEFLVEDPCFAQDFAPDGSLITLGSTMTRRRYADTLEEIARDGAAAFYCGRIAEATIRDVQGLGGLMTREDLSSYAVTTGPPLRITYRDFNINTLGAPSGGPVLLSTMKTVEGYDDMGERSNLNLSTHRLDEPIRFAYGERPKLGDPEFTPETSVYQEQMISSTSASKRRELISDSTTHEPAYYNPSGLGSVQNRGTVGAIAMDRSGMTVSLTTTVNSFFGSKVCIQDTGIIFNNQMNDFAIPGVPDIWGLPPAPANFVRPGKRALSSMVPTIVEFVGNSTVFLATSVSGGSQITTASIQALWHILDLGLTAGAALARPRFHEQLYPNVVSFDPAYDNSTTAFMRELGHNVTIAEGTTLVQAVRRAWNGVFDPAADPWLKNGGAVAG